MVALAFFGPPLFGLHPNGLFTFGLFMIAGVSFFVFVAAPKGVQGYVFIGLNQFTYHHRSNRSRWPGLVRLGAPPSPRLESQLLAVRGGRGVVVKMEAL